MLPGLKNIYKKENAFPTASPIKGLGQKKSNETHGEAELCSLNHSLKSWNLSLSGFVGFAQSQFQKFLSSRKLFIGSPLF